MPRKEFLILLSLAVAARILFSVVTDSRSIPDSEWYFTTGRQLVTGDYSDYNGKREPVYPLLTAALGFERNAIVFTQTVLGVVSSLLLYLIFSRLAGSAQVGLLAGLTQALNPAMIAYEFTVGTEATCTFLLILSIFLFFLFIREEKNISTASLMMLGISSGLVFLTRTQYVLYPAFIACILFLFLGYRKTALLRTTVFLVPVAVMGLSWSAFQYRRIGQFALSPDIGYALLDNTVLYIESAPDKYADIKNVLIKYRDEHIRRKGEAYGCIEAARPELERMTGLSYSDLSRHLALMSVQTIARRPLQYLKYTARAYLRFFKPFWPGNLYGVKPALRQGGWILRTVVATYVIVYTSLLGVFILFPVLYLTSRKWREAFPWRLELLFIYGLLLYMSIFQALVSYSENPRFHATLEPMILASALIIALQAWRSGLLPLPFLRPSAGAKSTS